jgi:outer membrane protein assembly factor BamB
MLQRHRRLVVGMVAVTATMLAASSADVAAAVTGSTQWLGDRANAGGTSANPGETGITTADVGSLHVAWRRGATFGYWGGVTVAGGTAYVGSGEQTVSAYDAVTGALRWRRTFSEPAQTGTPTVAGSLAYVPANLGSHDQSGMYHTVLYALDRATGHTVWRYTEPGGGYVYGSPILGGGVLYVPSTDGHIVAFDPPTGRVIWSRNVGSQYVVDADHGIVYANGRLYADSDSYTTVTALSAADGHRLWKYSAPGGELWLLPPTVANGRVYVGTGVGDENDTGYVDAYPAAGCGQETCAPLWRRHLPTYVTSSIAVASGRVFATTGDAAGTPGGAWALDATTGRVLWHWTGGEDNQNVSVGGDVVFVTSRGTQSLYAFAAAGCGTTTCKPRRVVTNLDDHLYAPLAAPAIVDTTAYVATGYRGLVALRP